MSIRAWTSNLTRIEIFRVGPTAIRKPRQQPADGRRLPVKSPRDTSGPTGREDFRSYQLALQLYKSCAQVKARAHVRDQLDRAALSVVLNLSEGSAKTTAKERARFYGTAYASVREVQTLLTILEQRELFKDADQLGGMLYKLRGSG